MLKIKVKLINYQPKQSSAKATTAMFLENNFLYVPLHGLSGLTVCICAGDFKILRRKVKNGLLKEYLNKAKFNLIYK